MMFSVKNIHKRYRNNIVLNGFSFDFEKRFFLLTGVNGIGKSTLLKIIAKVINPTNNNYNIKSGKVAYLCEKIELVSVKAKYFLKKISLINKIAFDVQKELEKWNVPNKNISSLSKGNKQKIALIMMKYTNADIFLFDEPTDALDQDGINLFKEMITYLIDNGKTIIISTHEKSYFYDFDYEELTLRC